MQAQKLLLRQEEDRMHGLQVDTDVACAFLPDYLEEEVQGGSGAELSENMQEFMPATLYTEQLMRILPKEIAVRFKIYPGFEETLMRWQEKYDQDKKAK